MISGSDAKRGGNVMKCFFGKCGIVPAIGLATFLLFWMQPLVHAAEGTLQEEYRTPMLSGSVETWVNQGEDISGSTIRVFADDLEDGDLTADIRRDGEVDTSVPGNYTVSYRVTDSDGKSAELNTVVHVLSSGEGAANKKIQRKLYTLPAAKHLTDIGFNRGYYHDRQNLGIWLPANAELKIRLVNYEEFGEELELRLFNDDAWKEQAAVQEADGWSESQNAVNIPSDGSFITVKNSYHVRSAEGEITQERKSADSVPFITTPKDTTVQPIVEIEWSDAWKEIPFYRYQDEETEFFRIWEESEAPFAIIEGDSATFLVPEKDRDRIIDAPGVKEAYQFHTIDGMLEWYAAFIRQYDAFVGLDFYAKEACHQNVRAKFFIKANVHGYGAAYYSGDHSANNDDSLGGYLEKNWVSLHEFGHGYEGSFANQENSFVETTNNILGYYFEETYRPEEDSGWMLYNFSGSKTQRYKELGTYAKNRRETTGTFNEIVEGGEHFNASLFMFTNVLDRLGPEKTVSAMHSQYRKFCYDNGKPMSSSDVIAESFSKTGQYNVIPYFESWHIRPAKELENEIYEMDLPMLYYLNDIITDKAACERVRSKLNLDGIYSLVSTDDLADTGYKSQATLKISIDDLSQIQNKNIVIKNGGKIVKKIPVTGKTIQTELPVGIYEIELPMPRTADYRFQKEYFVAAQGNAAKEFSYEKIKGNPLLYDVEIQLLGLGDGKAASVSLDTERQKLIWEVEHTTPHSFFEETYLSIRILNASGEEVFAQSLAGNVQAEALTREFDFPEGSKVEIYHRESGDRFRFKNSYLDQRIYAYQLPGGEHTQTYVMTENGLMGEDWSQERRKDTYLSVLDEFSAYLAKHMTQSDAADQTKFYLEKAAMTKAYSGLSQEDKKKYLDSYGALLGMAPKYYAGYRKIPSQKLRGSADSEHTGAETAASAVDGNEDTFWHSNYGNGTKPNLSEGKNNSYTILLDENTDIGKLEYLPRKGGGNGVILTYEISYSTSETGEDFTVVTPRGNTWEDNDTLKSAVFEAPNARRIKVTALSTGGYPANTHISAAEFYLYEQYPVFASHTYASDLFLAESAKIKKDKNGAGQAISFIGNGEQRTFEKGIGMKTDVSVSWDLTGKKFDLFTAWIGIDAQVAPGLQASVEIYGDGKLLYVSDPLLSGYPAESVCLEITGMKKLEVRASGAGKEALVSLGDAKFMNQEDITEITLIQGESAAILANASLIPEDLGKIRWESDNPAIAAVNEEGMVTAVGEGRTVVRAVCSSKTVSCTVQVTKEPKTNQDETEPPKNEPGQDTKQEQTVKPKKVVLKKIKVQKKQAVVSWKKITDAHGYEVWMKKGNASFKKVKSVSAKKLKIKIKKLKSGKKYTFQVRAYRKDSSNKKVYGDFSKKKKVKIK